VPCEGCTALPPIALTGVGIDGVLTLSPNPVSFGPVDAGQSATAVVTAANTGTAAVRLTSMSTRDGAGTFFVSSAPALPLVLLPGQASTLTVEFLPTAGGALNDELEATWSVGTPTVPTRLAVDPLQGQVRP
jgi:hypothetical protein